MNPDPIFFWIERSALSIWLRESTSLLAFPFILILHAIGMGFLAGTAAAMGLRVLGLLRAIPLGAMARFLPFAWVGFWINAVSGVLLLIAYPGKALTNPLFYFKLACIAVAVAFLRMLTAGVLRKTPEPVAIPMKFRRMAGVSLALWVTAITSGRLLAYTYTRLLTDN